MSITVGIRWIYVAVMPSLISFVFCNPHQLSEHLVRSEQSNCCNIIVLRFILFPPSRGPTGKLAYSYYKPQFVSLARFSFQRQRYNIDVFSNQAVINLRAARTSFIKFNPTLLSVSFRGVTLYQHPFSGLRNSELEVCCIECLP